MRRLRDRARRFWSGLPLRTKGLLVVAIPLVPLVCSTLVVARAAQLQGEADSALARTLAIMAELEETWRLIVDAESGVRGYLLVGDRQWLEPYESATPRLAGRLHGLGPLLEDAAQHERLSRIRRLNQRHNELLGELAQPRPGPGIPPATSELLVQSRRELRATKAELAALRAAEEERLAFREARARDARRTSIVVAVAGLVCGLLGGLAGVVLFTAGVARRIRLVAANTDRLAEGLPPEPVEGRDEVGRLARELEHLAGLLAERDRELQRRMDELSRASADIRDLYDHAPCWYHSLDEHGTFVRINATALAWLGATAEEIIGRVRFSDLLTPDSRARFEANFARFKESGEARDLEYGVVGKDGATFTVTLSASAVRDQTGRIVMSRASAFDITARKRIEAQVSALNRELEAKVAELRALNDELEAFSYSVSHDLRAPLRHITGFADLLRRHAEPALDAKARRYLDTITGAATSMGQLIDDLLVFSRMGRTELRSTRVDLGGLVRDVIRECADLAAGRDVEWRVNGLPHVLGDPALLHGVLVNLLSNALKYTAPRPRAVIEVGQLPDAGDERVFFVRDNGVGFDMAYADRLFGVFQRLHRADEFEGTGIGLANVRRVIQRHGGRTWAEGAVDRGATFYFTLPAREENTG